MSAEFVSSDYVENPGSLNNFLENGGTEEEWQDRATEFFRYRQSLGLSDAELLRKASVEIEEIDLTEERAS